LRLRDFLAHPLTRGLNINDPRTTALRRRIIDEKRFLRKIYSDWYELIAAAVPPGSDPALELGSGAGFLKDYLTELITSDLFPCKDTDVVLDATRLPFANQSLRALVMTDVLHHIPDVKGLLLEATRCVRPGGVIAMVEPWVTWWSRFVYTRLHDEPFDDQTADWTIASDGPLSGANSALPWILFVRDREKFRDTFPEWEVTTVEPLMPFRYFLSGGVSLRSLMPGWSYELWKLLEQALPSTEQMAMFAFIVLTRRPVLRQELG
jgi:SAM-dependent methyltransferase